MTIRATLLARGYFPKELPPTFYTEAFAAFASSNAGRRLLASYRRKEGMECVDYSLALPGINRRDLRIPHPVEFTRLVAIAAKGFKRLLRKAHQSPITRSRPSYSETASRAIAPAFKPWNLPRERTLARSAGSFLARADISQFYPSLYTHAVGWAIDPKLRDRANWQNTRLLGKRVDQSLMDLQGKVSQGIPIGNDLSFLLAEVVLGEVDRKLGVDSRNAFRWYDDYEASFPSRAEAERFLAKLTRELGLFRLRLNPAKTRIGVLPSSVEDDWRDMLAEQGRHSLLSARDMVQFFDLAFRLRAANPEAPVLLYALGILFKLRAPSGEAEGVALSCISQALLAEPGVAQKAFALLRFWMLNGFTPDRSLLALTIARIIARHDTTGLSSDVSWALFFCLEARIPLDKRSGKKLSEFQDDAIAIQACHMSDENLFAGGFSKTQLAAELTTADPDGPHWLAAYELVRQGHCTNAAVNQHPVLSAMLARGIPFYRRQLPAYASLLHPGGAPEWAIMAFLRAATSTASESQRRFTVDSPVLTLVQSDVGALSPAERTNDELVTELFGGDHKRLLASLDLGGGYA